MSEAKSSASETERTIFPTILGLLFLAVMIGAWFVQKPPAAAAAAATPSPSPDTASTPAPTTAEATPAPSPATTPAAPETPEEFKALKGDVADLAKKFDDLQAKVDGLPKPEPAPDIKGLETKVAELSKIPETVGELPKKVETVEERLAASDEGIKALKAEIASLQETVKTLSAKPAASPTPATTPAPEPAKPADAAEALAPAADLFKKAKYAEARDAVKALETSNPDDARVWYLAALTNGLSTGKWDGETEALVNKGIAAEKAGKPDAAAIDAVFTGLTTATGKDWLAGYRLRAKK